MRQNLTPKILYNEYKLGLIDKKSACDFLTSFIENNNDENLRIESIKLIQEIENNTTTKFNLFKNLLISDSNESVRYTTAKLIIKYLLFLLTLI